MKPQTWMHLEGTDESLVKNWLLELRRERYRSNRTGREHDFYVVELADAVTVIAVTPPPAQVVLVRQFRAGSQLDGWEPPGGLLDPGEDPLEAAKRELLEETGFAGDEPVVLGTCWAVPSLLTSRITTVLVNNARRVADPKPDIHEEVMVDLVPAGAVPRMIRDGRIHHGLAMQSLLMWLISQIPNNPVVTVPDNVTARNRGQFRIRALLILVLVSALALAAARWLGPRNSFAVLGLASASFPSILWSALDERRKSIILLRGARWSGNVIITRLLAAVGAWTLGALLLLALMGLLRFL